MKVEGEVAKGFIAVSLSDFSTVNRGELVMADDATGDVRYKDATGEEKSVTLGPHAIRILGKYPR